MMDSLKKELPDGAAVPGDTYYNISYLHRWLSSTFAFFSCKNLRRNGKEKKKAIAETGDAGHNFQLEGTLQNSSCTLAFVSFMILAEDIS